MFKLLSLAQFKTLLASPCLNIRYEEQVNRKYSLIQATYEAYPWSFLVVRNMSLYPINSFDRSAVHQTEPKAV